ncbi:protein kinase vwkA [Seminavis robusta]|uniref:Protein kinase vwkA n=1 Tax=Seminavis robusta TaxID=568900 RepID=A0A9N8EBJ2_9STRA|nr:protein kinase vwkA [Seminavis robusta]|eukprot:Sro905_g218510.1 protein kinase vwkA (648) ;mRNA; f:15585-17528
MTKTPISILDIEDGWAGVDTWENPGILAEAEALEAEDYVREFEQQLEEAEKSFSEHVASAKDRMEEMDELIKKAELSTATKKEMERMEKLDEEIKRLNVDLAASRSAVKAYKEELVKSRSKTKTYALMKTAKEHEIKDVIHFVREAETVDLAFLLDCTGSMTSLIEATKSSMKDVVRKVTRTNAGLQLRVAVVGYRDIGDTNHFEILDFTPSVDVFERFVSSLEAQGGGGDATEDIAGAFQKANTLSWQQTSRITFLIADYPCHGSKYYNQEQWFDGWDDRPEGTPGISIETEMRKLMHLGGQAGMQLHFGRITPLCDTMISVFAREGLRFEVCDLKDPSNLSSSVSSSVRKSISKSVTVSKSKSKSKTGEGDDLLEEGEVTTKEYTIVEAKPSADEWKSLVANPVSVLCNKPISSVNDLKAPLHFGLVRWGKSESTKTIETKMFMRLAKDPFAEGEMRLAHYGKIGQDKAALASNKGDKVLKSFKKTRKPSSQRNSYLAQMEVSTISQFLAEEYNKTNRPPHCAEIHFLSVNVVEAEGGEWFCAEDELPCAGSDFMKYSNNTGYWNEDEINQSLLLFTQFTFEKTKGFLMVTDLQGVRNGNQYVLTDPAILCKDNTRFGGTNLGCKLMDKCMTSTQTMLEENGWDD